MSGSFTRFRGIEFQGVELPTDGAEGVPLSLIAQAEARRRRANEIALTAPAPDPQSEFDRPVLYGPVDPQDRDPHQ